VNAENVLKGVETVLVIDWPVGKCRNCWPVVHGGPEPEDYSTYEVKGGQVVEQHIGRPPARADLIYSYRPLRESAGIIATAKELGAKTIWSQSGVTTGGVSDAKGCWVPDEELRLARNLAESAGLNYISEPYIGDVAREMRVTN